MKRKIYLPFALLIAAPSLVSAEIHGDLTLGLRAVHYGGDGESAKFGEYRDLSDGLFGSVNLFADTENSFIDLSIENPSLDDQFYEVKGGLLGIGKARVYFDQLNHQQSNDALTPASGVGTGVLIIPDADTPGAVPPMSTWTTFDYEVDRKIYGAELTVDTQIPFYFKASVERQLHEGVKPWATFSYSGFELPMPIDYTTNNFMLEGGYRSQETNVVLVAGYSKFENDNDLLTTYDGVETQEYGAAADNYSYNVGGRLVQRLPMDSVLALKASFNRNVSEVDFTRYTTIGSPAADGTYDGDIRYLRAGAALTSHWSDELDSRLFYNYVDRNNNSDEIISVDQGGRTNHLFEYDRHDAGVETNYRINKKNKLQSGYEFSYTDRNREDAVTTMDNLLFTQLKNTSLDWMIATLRLEYLNRSSDTEYGSDTLDGDGLIHLYFTPFDYASKDRYKSKLAFDFSMMSGVGLGLSYAFVYDDYDATMLGVQDDQRHEIYADANFQLPAKINLNTFIGYEYTKSTFDSRRYNPGSPDPFTAPDSSNFNWNQETTYDFFVVGGSLTVPVMRRLDLVVSADHQLVDGNVDFARSAATGAALQPITEADDYYKTQAGLKGIFQATDAWSITLGYLYEKSNLDEWKYSNYDFNPGSGYLSGAGLDQDYEAHLVYMSTRYRF